MEQSDIQKIDAHSHVYYDRDFLGPILDEWKLKIMVINITGKKAFKESMQKRWDAMVEMHRRYPDRIALCTSFDPAPVTEADFAESTIDRLRRDIEQGACMVKVWKDIGLEVKDHDGSYVQVDDARFQPVWDFLAKEGIPVVAHIGEPRAAWLPLDPASPHYRYYSANPQYHFYRHPEGPDWETIMGARDRWVERNPNLTVIGAHLGSMAYDVGEVAKRMDRYPNFNVDMAERFGDMALQPTDKVRDFLVQYQDRLLYGTDFIVEEPDADVSEEDREKERAEYQDRLETEWQYLTTDSTVEATFNKFAKPVQTKALDLPDAVIEKLYRRNAARWLPSAFTA